ncbi:SpoIIE family protein phosphatase [Leptospira sp. 2 VSF19]|uniref:SpoIIE family protein phosphatase n=1 Tax=Leptospira soteropolitanensis TaxID=2950025 RepID=A0AAW5V7Q0_9LEPT|nr:7TM diverse intracellular signaling domain-containing protein [Leptospira soteropolitanensis]MCW7491429.1 SpoIIE family protein phosphatase [Leptospira soteropolitanensis]MCW7499013.1 SpoIIE family protein phosphatase [Leptospira soteropolitanensis]MCW7521395.1 SpoIIE family protein phosphatase [Leptospira soteropolitanensis]MCW7525117.1 SpoIIE family protein phosphatase [Leptospira soteropolitanensis]MCW7528984.1 SpoIIE family protein phosphatase [Leptospira soteropolitanensis]
MKRKTKTWFVILTFLVFGIFPISAEEVVSETIDIQNIDHSPIYLAKSILVYEDLSNQLDFDSIRATDFKNKFVKVSSSKEAFNFSYSKSTYWLKVQLKNPEPSAKEVTFVISYPRLKTLDLYFQSSREIKKLKSGYSVPMSERPYQSRFFVFPILFPENTDATVYLKVESPNSINIPIQLWNTNLYDRYEINDHVIQALYFGIALAMVLFNLFLFFILKDSNYFLYVLVVLSTAFTIASHNGISSEYFWPNSPWMDQYSVNLFISIVLVLFLIFMRRLLNTKQLIPRFDRISLGFIILQIIFPICYILSFDSFVKGIVLSHTLTSFWILLVGIICSFKKERIAYFFLLSFSFLFLALIVSTLRALGLIPTNSFTIDGPQYGSAAEMMLLAFALADRYNMIIKEKEAAEAQIKFNLEKSNLDLEVKVKERTDKLNKTLNAMKRDLFVAKKIQENSLITDSKLIKDLNLEYRYLPVSEVGGDFLDISLLKESKYRVLIADATGHGVQAAMISMATKGLYDNVKTFELPPSKVMEIFNEEFMDNFVSLNSLLTAMIIDIDLQEKKIQYASAGHPAAVLLQNDQIQLLTKTGKMIGLKKQIHYGQSELTFGPNDRLFVFTDGVFEAFNSKEEEFGEESLYHLFQNTRNLSLAEVEDYLLKTLQSFLNDQDRQDDLTILGIDF